MKYVGKFGHESVIGLNLHAQSMERSHTLSTLFRSKCDNDNHPCKRYTSGGIMNAKNSQVNL